MAFVPLVDIGIFLRVLRAAASTSRLVGLVGQVVSGQVRPDGDRQARSSSHPKPMGICGEEGRMAWTGVSWLADVGCRDGA
jgi:hypothetical protein